MSTRIEELEAYNRAGIGIVALTLDIRLRQLAVGFENQWICDPALEPLDDWFDEEVTHCGLARDRIEDYVTTCLGGSAGVFLYNLGRRRHTQCSQGDAGLQMKHLPNMWQGAEPETDRAFAIAFALLVKIDDGDTEGTMLRLWQRAVQLLRQPSLREQLDRLAHQLMQAGKMSGEEVVLFLQS